MAGTLWMAASKAAPIVPEVNRSSIPSFGPMFIPDTSQSGMRFRILFTAIRKESAGVPVVAYAFVPSPKQVSVMFT